MVKILYFVQIVLPLFRELLQPDNIKGPEVRDGQHLAQLDRHHLGGCAMCNVHRRRIKTDEKAKVVAAVWGTEFIQGPIPCRTSYFELG